MFIHLRAYWHLKYVTAYKDVISYIFTVFVDFMEH